MYQELDCGVLTPAGHTMDVNSSRHHRMATSMHLRLRRCGSVPRLARRAFSSGAARLEGYEGASVPTIDLSPLRPDQPPPASLVEDVASACADWGFFQVVGHGMDPSLRARAEEQQHAFFALPMHIKEAMRRTAGNSRGWYARLCAAGAALAALAPHPHRSRPRPAGTTTS